MSIKEYEQQKATIDSLRTLVANQSTIINALNTQLKVRDDSIAFIYHCFADEVTKGQTNKKAIGLLQDSVAQQNKEIVMLTEQLASLDMVRLRYANGRLQMPYNRQKVQEAIELFDGIQDPELKKRYQVVKTLLNQYESSLNQVKNLISKFQASPERTNKFNLEEWQKMALTEIAQNSYVASRRPGQYSILYLDDIIERAKKRIEVANESFYPDFSDLLEMLTVK